MSERLNEIFERLLEHFGPQHWWPGEGRTEIIIGAILTQNTNWGNVEKAISNLKGAGAINLDKLHRMDTAVLAELIRPAGYYNIKAARLKNFLNWLFDKYEGNLETIEHLDIETFRRELLGIKGIGRETADSILLYAFRRARFVVDAYTARVAVRHHLISSDCGYEELQNLFESNLDDDVDLFNEFHALIVRLAKQYCKKKPVCSGCPLEDLPHTIEEF